MSDENTNCSIFLILLKVLLLLILYFADIAASSSCQIHCGGVKIPYPFGIGKSCYMEKSYEIKCLNSTISGKLAPFLSVLDREVVDISLPFGDMNPNLVSTNDYDISFGSVRVKIMITSSGCGGKDPPELIMNFKGTPFFIDDVNSLIAVGCNAKVTLTHIEPNMVGCKLRCNTSKDQTSNSIPFLSPARCWSNRLQYKHPVCEVYKPEVKECDGNGCCNIGLIEPQQAIGIIIESNDGNSTTAREENCRVAFMTDEVYTSLNATKPRELLDKGYTIAEITYAHCVCRMGYTGNPYDPHGCQGLYIFLPYFLLTVCVCKRIILNFTNGFLEFKFSLIFENPDVDECKTHNISCGGMNTCVNTQGGHHCVADKKKAILIGFGSSFGALALVSGVWWLKKFLINRRMTKRRKKFFKRNGGLLLQQKLYTREGNVETTRIFSSGELEKATEKFSENRVLGQGGQGTVYKGMLVDGRTVAVKKSKIIDEDKLQEFINEVVILSQINHRHIKFLLPMLVYEFILNGNLFQHIHEDSDDYTMKWGMRLRIAVDVAGALSYLHSSASSPIYHRDIKSTNILLDEKHRAKVADFGTSRSITIDQTHWTTVVSGTVGYVDPEYYRSSQFTDKSDVYSFGVVLAELITGDKPVVMIKNTRETISLAEHFRLAVKQKRFSDIIDARIKEGSKLEQVVAVANLAVKCLSSKGNKRPNMREVYTSLERIFTSPEDSQAQVQIDEEEEEEVRNMVNEDDSLSVGVTAPAFSIAASPSSSGAEPLFPRPTW
ncbi:hypothetical protein N665_0120s0038 [Sinapis alba]|nr:hypothetical protein N665_0120s0038 [Sinapis alba]